MTDYEKDLAGLTDYERDSAGVDTSSMSDYERDLAEAEPEEVAPQSEPSWYDPIVKAAEPVIDRTVKYATEELPYAPQDVLAGTVKGWGDVVDATKYLDPKHYIAPEMTSVSEQSGQAIQQLGDDMAHDKDSFAFFGGEMAGPLPTAQPLKAVGSLAKGAHNLTSPVLDVANKLGSKVTEPIVNKGVEMLTRPSTVGSIPDRLKTLFVQDYKLDPKFVDMIDTQVRQGAIQTDDVMDLLKSRLEGLSQDEIDNVQYLIGKDRVAFPEAAQRMDASGAPFRAVNRNLYGRANSFRNQIFKNEDELIRLGMLDSNPEIENRQMFTNIEVPYDGRAYVNRQYKAREKLEGQLDPTLNAGRTIVDRRGMYDDQGNFIRPFTGNERRIMEPETYKVAEKSTARQLDKIVQGEVMDRTLNNFRHLVKTPEEMKTFVGGTPKASEKGYTLLQGKQYGNLSGHYVQDQTAIRLKSMVDDIGNDPSLWNAYRKYVGQWKAAVTIKNPKTHINNMLGNIGMLNISGVDNSQILSIMKNGWKYSGDTEGTVYKSAQKAGLLDRTKVQELEQMSGFNKTQSSLSDSKNTIINNPLTRNLYMTEKSKVGDKVFGAYQKEDEVYKLGIFDHYLKQGMSAKEARAATEKIVFDYAKKLPKGVEFLRDTGLIPFVTWTYRSLPMFAEVLAKRPAHLAATAGALALLNEGEDSLTEPTVNGSRLNSKNWTPYMEYLDPQQFVKDQTLSGIPQQAAAIASGNTLKYGRMRTLDKKGTEPIDSLLGRGKALYDLLPVPDVYNDLYDIATDKKRTVGEGAVHRLLFTNTPQTGSRSRNRKRRSRKRESR